MPDDTGARHSIGGNNPEPLDDIPSPLFSVPRTRKYLGDMSLTTLYEKMAQGELEVVKLGGRTFITRASCDEYIRRNTSRSIGDRAAIESAKKAARESVRKRAEAKSRQQRAEAKKKLVPGKQRRRREQRATEAPKAPAKRKGEAASRPANDTI